MTIRFMDKDGHYKIVDVTEVEVEDFGVCNANPKNYKFREMTDTYSAGRSIELIKCRDCMYYHDRISNVLSGGYCGKLEMVSKTPEGFCDEADKGEKMTKYEVEHEHGEREILERKDELEIGETYNYNREYIKVIRVVE